ncbi:MAG: hypothetical protein HY319_31115 [Armatimonadetes bacterium]|nr:hypothetical protein [Armatimonadota bacterium]
MNSRTWAGFLFFAGLWFVNVIYHQLWFDELQAWGIARASGDLLELYRNTQYEGHPMLWHTVIWPAARLTGDPRGMQVVHGGLVLLSLGLLWFRSPFTLLEKGLLSGSYFLVYEYAVLSRCYGLGVALLFLFLTFRERFSRHPWLGWLILGLLANTHFLLAMLAVMLAVVWVAVERRQGRNVLPGVSLFVLMLGAALVCVSRADPHTAIESAWSFDFSFSRVMKKLDTFADAFAPLENPFSLDYWRPGMGAWLSLIAGFLTLWLIWRYLEPQKVALGAFLALSAGMIAFFYLRYGGHSWHGGLMFLFLVSLVWLLRDKGLRLGPPVAFLILLCLNAGGGLKAVVASKFTPISRAHEAARWIRDHGLENEFWIGYQYASFSIAVCLDRPIFDVESGHMTRYVDYGVSKERRPMPLVELSGWVQADLGQRKVARAYLVVGECGKGNLHERACGLLKLHRELELAELARFPRGENSGESYLLYRVDGIRGKQSSLFAR